ncbi:MAG: sulfatase-like hydrolase/transferase [Longimicrobiales bacterium]
MNRAGSIVNEARRNQTNDLPASTVVAIAVWFALAAGMGEVIIRLVLKVGIGQMLRVPYQFVWMAPVANLVLFTIVGGLLLSAGAFSRRLRSRRAIVLAFSFLTLLAWSLLIPRLSPWGALVLCAGLAWQLSSRLVSRMTAGFLTRGVAVLAVIGVVVSAALNASLIAVERKALANLPAARAGVPNVLFVIWDTVRAESLSLYGHARRTTPNLERLASRGVLFTKAISTSPWTLPAHASMFTGRLPHETSVAWYAPLDGSHVTIAEQLRDRGWVTGGFAANPLYVDREHGLARGFAHFEDYRVTPGQIMVASSLGGRILRGAGGWTPGLLRTLLGHHHKFIGRKWADQVNAALLAWLDEREAERPFFAFLNYFDAHLPYDPPPPFDTIFGPARRETSFAERLQRVLERRDKWDLPEDDIAAEIRAYEASIAYLDDRLGLLLDSLQARGVLDNTLVIVTSDHGEEFGEHGMFEHGGNLYFEQIHVPLVLSLPGHLPEGLVIEAPVSTRELAATIDAIAQSSPVSSLPGPPLTRFWTVAGNHAIPVLAELVPGREPGHRMTTVLAEGFQFIRNPDGTSELYDLASDWAEQNDRSTTRDANTIIARVRAAAVAFASCDSAGCCCTLPPGLFTPAPPADRTRTAARGTE